MAASEWENAFGRAAIRLGSERELWQRSVFSFSGEVALPPGRKWRFSDTESSGVSTILTHTHQHQSWHVQTNTQILCALHDNIWLLLKSVLSWVHRIGLLQPGDMKRNTVGYTNFMLTSLFWISIKNDYRLVFTDHFLSLRINSTGSDFCVFSLFWAASLAHN